ncbi:MAG TPA: protein-L-isoaspartate(D-aspartate) O-methyltransferase [Thermoplasmata archaeon]|nr:protein-L-isoaspartate(D-aspartate) O-methyltransferase [Thermoplasmata archaeon]
MARPPEFAAGRERLVRELLAEGDIRTPRVQDAVLQVPREEFVRPTDRGAAYADVPLPIGEGQTISAPSMIAIMLEEARLEPGERVLEVGTGSGYHAALLACLVGAQNVTSIERIPPLAVWGQQNLARTGFGGVTVVQGDGSLGYRARGPYDCILATAGSPRIPEAWPAQLSERGRIVAPIGDSRFGQVLVIAHRRPDGRLEVRRGTPCAFVPLIGEQAWPSP